MMAEGGEGLDDDGVSAIGKADGGGEVGGGRSSKFRVQCSKFRSSVSPRVNRGGIAAACHVPAGEVEEVDGLFENPTADALAIVAPAARSLAIGKTGELDERRAGLADGAL